MSEQLEDCDGVGVIVEEGVRVDGLAEGAP